MEEYLRYLILELREFSVFMAVAAGLAVVGSALFFLMARRLMRRPGIRVLLCVFLNVDWRTAAGMALIYLKLVLLFTAVLSFMEIPLGYFLFLGLGTLALMATLLRPEKMFAVFVYNLLLAVGMFVQLLLRSYLIDVGSSLRYLVVFLMMCVCMLVFAVYIALMELQLLLEEKRMDDEETA